MRAFLCALLILAGAIIGGTFTCQEELVQSSRALPWRGQYNDLFMAYRSNAPHFWSWLKQQKSPLLEPQGVVSGDPHILNFADVLLKNGQRTYTLVDVDDAGIHAPLAGDLLRYLIGNQISPFKIDAATLIEAYQNGLRGYLTETPEFLKELEALSRKDNEGAQEKYLRKLITGGRFSEKAGLTSLSESPPAVQKLFQNVSKDLHSKLSGYEILDVGYRTKSEGGSQGLVRFWFLLRKNSNLHIWEFKEQAAPATAEFQLQGNHQERFRLVIETYRPLDTHGPFEVITSGEHSFLLRERTITSLDFDPAKVSSEKEVQRGQELSLYLANKLGQWHSPQKNSKDLDQLLRQEEFRHQLLKMAEAYITLMQKELAP